MKRNVREMTDEQLMKYRDEVLKRDFTTRNKNIFNKIEVERLRRKLYEN